MAIWAVHVDMPRGQACGAKKVDSCGACVRTGLSVRAWFVPRRHPRGHYSNATWTCHVDTLRRHIYACLGDFPGFAHARFHMLSYGYFGALSHAFSHELLWLVRSFCMTVSGREHTLAVESYERSAKGWESSSSCEEIAKLLNFARTPPGHDFRNLSLLERPP